MPYSEIDRHFREGPRPAHTLWQWLRAACSWQLRFEAGVYAYYENEVTGARKAVRAVTGGYSPVDRHWLDAVR